MGSVCGGEWWLELGTRPPGFLPLHGTASYWTSDFPPLLELPPLLAGRSLPRAAGYDGGEMGSFQPCGPVQ